jgi:hypothetical protein
MISKIVVTRLLAPLRTLYQKRRKMMSEIVVTTLLAFLLLTIVQSAKCDIAFSNFGVTQTTEPQRFRILVVEASFSDTLMRSGQYLIRSLMNFSNWNNSTDKYVSFVELLSLYNSSEVFEDCRRFLKDKTTKTNVHNEIISFLGAAQPGEVTIFYYSGDGGGTNIGWDEIITADELTSWLMSGGLPQAYVCVVLDCCNSGAWINDGLSPGNPLGPNRVVLCSSKSNELSWSWSFSAWTWFTGQEKTIRENAKNGTWLPLGVIGGLFGANDTNHDGWVSASEDFAFAMPSTKEYASLRNETQTPVMYNGLGYDPPLVLIPTLPPVASFNNSPNIAWPNESITFNASNSNGTIANYSWNFGDGNVTTVSTPTVTHTFSKEGRYTVTLNVTDSSNQWNTTSTQIIVTFKTDLNRDKTVNILDITIVAAAYGSKPGDPKWNALADLDKNSQVNILDVTMVARDYNKAVT